MEASRAARLVRHRADPDPLTARQAGGTGGAIRPRQLRGRGVLYRPGRGPEPGRDLVPGDCRDAGARRHREAAGRNVRRLEAGCLRPLPEPCDQPVFTRVKVHRDYHGEVARALSSVLSICSPELGRPRRQPARVLSWSSRHPHVRMRAVISSTQVRSARPPWVCTVRIRKWSSAA